MLTMPAIITVNPDASIDVCLMPEGDDTCTLHFERGEYDKFVDFVDAKGIVIHERMSADRKWPATLNYMPLE